MSSRLISWRLSHSKKGFKVFLSNGAIVLVMLAFLGMGLGALISPHQVTQQFGISSLTAAGKNEVRAVYGGFGLAMAFMLLVAIYQPELKAGICFTLSAALAGMAFGRFVSWSIDKSIARMPLFYLLLEAILAAILYGVA